MVTIDGTNGAVGWGTATLAPGLTEAEFAQSELGKQSKRTGGHTVNGVYYSNYRLPNADGDGYSAAMTLYFENSKMSMIDISFGIVGDGAGWESWTVEQELRRQAVHHAFIQQQLGTPHEVIEMPEYADGKHVTFTHLRYEYAWGRVGSTYDNKGGFSDIYIRYA